MSALSVLPHNTFVSIKAWCTSLGNCTEIVILVFNDLINEVFVQLRVPTNTELSIFRNFLKCTLKMVYLTGTDLMGKF